MALQFEWDVAKAAGNFAKHDVTFEEAATAFGDPLARITDDPRHTAGESRLALLGLSDRGRLLAVMFTDRGTAVDPRVRLISARRATRHERNEYEEAAP